MPYLEIKTIKENRYVYVKHDVRLPDRRVKLHLAYLGPLSALLDPSGQRYSAHVDVLINNPSIPPLERNRRVHALLRASGVRFDVRGLRARAERIEERRARY